MAVSALDSIDCCKGELAGEDVEKNEILSAKFLVLDPNTLRLVSICLSDGPSKREKVSPLQNYDRDRSRNAEESRSSTVSSIVSDNRRSNPEGSPSSISEDDLGVSNNSHQNEVEADALECPDRSAPQTRSSNCNTCDFDIRGSESHARDRGRKSRRGAGETPSQINEMPNCCCLYMARGKDGDVQLNVERPLPQTATSVLLHHVVQMTDALVLCCTSPGSEPQLQGHHDASLSSLLQRWSCYSTFSGKKATFSPKTGALPATDTTLSIKASAVRSASFPPVDSRCTVPDTVDACKERSLIRSSASSKKTLSRKLPAVFALCFATASAAAAFLRQVSASLIHRRGKQLLHIPQAHAEWTSGSSCHANTPVTPGACPALGDRYHNGFAATAGERKSAAAAAATVIGNRSANNSQPGSVPREYLCLEEIQPQQNKVGRQKGQQQKARRSPGGIAQEDDQQQSTKSSVQQKKQPKEDADAALHLETMSAAPLHRMDASIVESYFQYYGKTSSQVNILRDSVRTSAYYKAIMQNKRDFKGKIVMDVGAGSGVLSFFAAQAGAKKVYVFF